MVPPKVNLDAMVAQSLRDVPSDEELSGDEDDPELLVTLLSPPCVSVCNLKYDLLTTLSECKFGELVQAHLKFSSPKNWNL